jgi:glycosyltransferase involved in cell wall biosynthesis
MTAPAPDHRRVALFISALDGGGAERVLVNLGAGLVERGIGVDLILVYDGGPYVAQLDPAIRVIVLGSSRLIMALPRLVRYLKTEQPDALVAALEDNNILAIAARALAGSATRCIVTVHNHLSVEARGAPRLRQRLAPHLAGWVYRFADHVVAVSRGVAEDLERCGVPPSKLSVIYNPITTDRLAAQGRQSVDHPWFATGGPPVVLGVGRLVPQKDFGTLLAAVALLRQRHECRLILVGDGPERAALETRAAVLGIADSVMFAGFVANPAAWMARAELVVLSSIFEGFGNVLVEAMAVGTPVVATDCPSGPDEVLDHGRYGRLVPPGDAPALAEAMAATLAMPTPADQLLARAALFSTDRAVDSYLPLLGLGGEHDRRSPPLVAVPDAPARAASVID